MDWRITTAVFSALGATALTLSLAKPRLDLSRAKHASLPGHARLSRRIASLIPFYTYDEREVFRSDGAPDEIAKRRRAAFMQLSALYRERFAKTAALTAQVRETISDLQ